MNMRVEGRLIQVAVPVPQIDPLTYSVPDEFPDPPIGVRVLVPLGKRTMTGVVVGAGTRDPGCGIRGVQSRGDSVSTDPGSRAPDPGTIKPIIDVLDSTPFLPSDVVALALW